MTPSRPVVVEICARGTHPVAHTMALRTKPTTTRVTPTLRASDSAAVATHASADHRSTSWSQSSCDTRRMEPTRVADRLMPVRRSPLPALVLVMVALTGCVSSAQSPEVPTRYQDPEVGAARLMADATTRVSDVVNVTDTYPDPHHQILGAAVLIDDRIGQGVALTDRQHRPVFIAYVSKRAARQAAAGRRVGTFLRNGVRVILLPEGFPEKAKDAYDEGLGAALQ